MNTESAWLFTGVDAERLIDVFLREVLDGTIRCEDADKAAPPLGQASAHLLAGVRQVQAFDEAS